MRTVRTTVAAACLVGAALVGVGIGANPAGAATLTVTNCNDSGSGSLRQAVATANPGDTINFAPSPSCSLITLSSTIDVSKNLTIDGPGANALAVSGNHANTVIGITSANAVVVISGLTIEDGFAVAASGGGIDNEGTLTVTNSTVSDNTAGASGGGIWNGSDTLTVTNSTVSNNTSSTLNPGGYYTGQGGGIYNNAGTVAVTNSTVSNNSAGYGGGGILSNSGTVTVTNSTVSSNSGGPFSSDGEGGGILDYSGTVMVINSTLSYNASDGSGGGIWNQDMLTVTNSTLSYNDSASRSPGGGIYNVGSLTVTNSTVSGNNAGGGGGGIYGSGTITNSTVSNNSAGPYVSQGGGIYGGGTITNSTVSNNVLTGVLGSGDGGESIYSYAGNTSLEATIVGNTNGMVGACFGVVTDNGYNIGDDGSCGFSGTSISDSATLDGSLGALANNGGPTQTIALLSGSPAIDKVPAADCPATDQRGVARTAPCDIGAYDTDTPVVTGPCPDSVSRCFTSGNSTSDPVGTSFKFPVTTTGTPTPKITEEGKLPKGVKFNKSTDTLAGTPTSTKHKSAAGTYPITFTATFGKGKSKVVVTQAFTLTIT